MKPAAIPDGRGAEASLLQFGAKKNRAMPGFFVLPPNSDERGISLTTTDLGHFSERKFFNFNYFCDGFHISPTPDDVDPKTVA
jgi:hypothetical protein